MRGSRVREDLLALALELKEEVPEVPREIVNVPCGFCVGVQLESRDGFLTREQGRFPN